MARKNRAEAPQLERGWDQADEERYAAGESVNSARENSEGQTDPSVLRIEPGMQFSMPDSARELGGKILQHVAADAPGFKGKHIELQLSAAESDFVSRLRLGLYEHDAQLAKGKHVSSNNDAMRWLLQQAMQVHAAATSGS